MSRIEEVLLGFGGEQVSREDSDFDEHLLGTGKLVKPRKVSLLAGRDQKCHRNSAGFHLMNYPDFKLVTGYALSGKRWVRHSCLVGRKGTVVETAHKRRLHFGVPLNDSQAAMFMMEEVFAISPSLLAHCEEQAAS